MVQFLRNALLAYKPIDTRLRRVPVYARMSRVLQKYYSVWLSGRRGRGPKPDAIAYAKNFDLIASQSDVILFESYWGRKFADNPLSMYRQLRKDYPQGHFKIFWAAADPEAAPPELTENPDVTLVKPGTTEYGIALLTAGYFVNNATFPPFFIRRSAQRYCNTWHGVPLKAMGRDMNAPLVSMANSQRNFLQSDVLLEMGSFYHWATIRPYYVDQLVAGSLLSCGAPRVDDVISPKVPAESLRARYGIAKRQTVILFAPTWRGNSTNVEEGAADDQGNLYVRLAQALGDDYFVVFSAHQMAPAPTLGAVGNGVILPDNENINDVLTIVDILVSDYSSIIFDFLPVDRPIVLFTPDIEEYRNTRGLYLLPKDLPCINTTQFDDLIAAIRVPRRPSAFPDYAIMRDRFVPFEDGGSAARALKGLLAPQKNPEHRKPDTRKRLLIAPGGMMPNGIISSLKNLLAKLDYDRFDPYVLIDASIIDRDPRRQEQFQEFDPRCNWILRCGDLLLTEEEAATYRAFRLGGKLKGGNDLVIIRRIFEREAIRVLGDTRFDVAIEFGGYAPYWAALIGSCNADRKVCYQHNDLWAEYSNPDSARNQRQLLAVFQIYKWFDQIVAVSDETGRVNAQHLAAYYPEGVPPRTVRNTINTQRIMERAREPMALENPEIDALFQDDETFCFIALGRLSPEKRYDRMIKAMARIAPAYPKAVLLICGSGPLEDELIQMAKRFRVAAQIRFLGQVSNPHPYLARADICVMSSDYEGQPMTLLEALCLGTPCIGTDIPGIRSVLKDGLGHIVAPNEEALAEAMKAALDRRLPELRRADITGRYVTETMQEFTTAVCGIAD